MKTNVLYHGSLCYLMERVEKQSKCNGCAGFTSGCERCPWIDEEYELAIAAAKQRALIEGLFEDQEMVMKLLECGYHRGMNDDDCGRETCLSSNGDCPLWCKIYPDNIDAPPTIDPIKDGIYEVDLPETEAGRTY